MYGNNIISAVQLFPLPTQWVFTSILSGSLHRLTNALYNGGPFQLVIFHFLIGIYAYMGREWELSYRLGSVPGSALLTAHLSLLLLLYSSSILSVKVVSPMLCLLVSLVLLTICLYSKQNTISLCTRSTCSVLLGYSVDLFSAMHKSATSSLVRETTETESQNYGYKFGQEEETYNIVAAHGYFGRPDFPICFFQQFSLAALLPRNWGRGHLVYRPRRLHHGVQPQRFNFNQSIIDGQGRCSEHLGGCPNRAGLGMEVMHERNAHNFPLDLAAAESTPVALTAPSIG